MPPKAIRSTQARPAAQKSFVRSTYDELTKPENRSVLTTIAVFALGVTVFHTSLNEFLVPA